MLHARASNAGWSSKSFIPCHAGEEMRNAVKLAVRQCDEDMRAMQGEHAKVNKELKVQLHAVLEQACMLYNCQVHTAFIISQCMSFRTVQMQAGC
jgi:hypothetical protein